MQNKKGSLSKKGLAKKRGGTCGGEKGKDNKVEGGEKQKRQAPTNRKSASVYPPTVRGKCIRKKARIAGGSRNSSTRSETKSAATKSRQLEKVNGGCPPESLIFSCIYISVS